MCPLGMEKQFRLQNTTSLYAESNRAMKAGVSHSPHMNWAVFISRNAGRVFSPELTAAVPLASLASGWEVREVGINWGLGTKLLSRVMDTGLNGNTNELAEVEVEEPTDTLSVDRTTLGRDWPVLQGLAHLSWTYMCRSCKVTPTNYLIFDVNMGLL